jgi:hypothetical protein
MNARPVTPVSVIVPHTQPAQKLVSKGGRVGSLSRRRNAPAEIGPSSTSSAVPHPELAAEARPLGGCRIRYVAVVVRNGVSAARKRGRRGRLRMRSSRSPMTDRGGASGWRARQLVRRTLSNSWRADGGPRRASFPRSPEVPRGDSTGRPEARCPSLLSATRGPGKPRPHARRRDTRDLRRDRLRSAPAGFDARRGAGTRYGGAEDNGTLGLRLLRGGCTAIPLRAGRGPSYPNRAMAPGRGSTGGISGGRYWRRPGRVLQGRPPWPVTRTPRRFSSATSGQLRREASVAASSASRARRSGTSSSSEAWRTG